MLSHAWEDLAQENRMRVGPASPSNTHVLLVDDTIMNNTLGKLMLEKLNCMVTQAYDGREALTLLKNSKYDLVLMEICMVEMSGIDSVAQYRAWEREHRPGYLMCIYAHTSSCTPEHQTLYDSCGFSGFIPRPCRPRNMLELIRSVTDKTQ